MLLLEDKERVREEEMDTSYTSKIMLVLSFQIKEI